MIYARSRSLPRAITSAALGPSRPMRMSSGPSKRNEKPRSACIELHRRHAEIEHDAVDRRADERSQIGKAILEQFEPALRLSN